MFALSRKTDKELCVLALGSSTFSEKALGCYIFAREIKPCCPRKKEIHFLSTSSRWWSQSSTSYVRANNNTTVITSTRHQNKAFWIVRDIILYSICGLIINKKILKSVLVPLNDEILKSAHVPMNNAVMKMLWTGKNRNRFRFQRQAQPKGLH